MGVSCFSECIEISIHAPARGATSSKNGHFPTMEFQSTLPRGERPIRPSPLLSGHDNFNPRSREGSDLFGFLQIQCREDFNPRSREGSDGYSRNGDYSREGFQSTLPRGERPPPGQDFLLLGGISIHAPARGATRRCWRCSETLSISIHAPARGAT